MELTAKYEDGILTIESKDDYWHIDYAKSAKDMWAVYYAGRYIRKYETLKEALKQATAMSTPEVTILKRLERIEENQRDIQAIIDRNRL